MLSILHFAYLDSVGGSGRSAWRIHTCLRSNGHQSRMLVGKKYSKDPDVAVLGEKPLRLGFLLDRIGRIVSDVTGFQDVLIPSTLWLQNHPWVRQSDIIQFFNTWGGFVSFSSLAKLSQARPVVWRLSDQWLMTGHCVYSYECDRWLTGCGQCPQVHGERALSFDNSALLWRLKRETYNKSNLVIVAPSRWMLDLAKASPLISQFPLHHIPNGVNTNVFHPMREKARSDLGLDPSARIVLFAAHSLDKGRKGGHLLKRAITSIVDIQGATLLLIGGKSKEYPRIPGWRIISLDHTRDENLLAAVFAAADLMVLPSLADNLPNTLLESISSGTPVVGFDVGGVGEIIHHMKTGYLAKPYDPDDLANGIRLLLTNSVLRMRLSDSCREIAIEGYSYQRGFKSLYHIIFSADSGSRSWFFIQ